MSSSRIRGIVAATHTPFNREGSLSLGPVETQAAHLLRHGVRYAFIAGTTGESHTLTLEERRHLTTRWMEVTRGTDLKTVVHVGGNSLHDAKALAAHAQQQGALAIAALSPSYFKPRTLDLLISCCAEIASAAPGLPFYYYDIPVLTGVTFPMGQFLTEARARIPTLAGLKFTNSDLMQLQCCLRAADGSLDILFGFDEMLLAALALGVEGAVGSTYNLAAPLYHRLTKAFHAGDLATARVEQLRSVALVEILNRHGFMSAQKAAMQFVGVNVGPTRLPLAPLSADQLKSLRSDLERVGFFDWIRP